MIWGDGCIRFAPNSDSKAWAAAAFNTAIRLARDPDICARNLRQGGTWFVGVDVLPNDPTGTIDGVPFEGPWQDVLSGRTALHRAQISIMYPGYPRADPEQSDANLRYRRTRYGAHVDGLLPMGPQRRRIAAEFHMYILGVFLNKCAEAPTMYWPGSHRILQAALKDAVCDLGIAQLDVTQAYHAARRQVFETIVPKPLSGAPGGAFLLHPFMLHGTAPWEGTDAAEGRMIAFFRPQFADVTEWLNVPV